MKLIRDFGHRALDGVGFRRSILSLRVRWKCKWPSTGKASPPPPQSRPRLRRRSELMPLLAAACPTLQVETEHFVHGRLTRTGETAVDPESEVHENSLVRFNANGFHYCQEASDFTTHQIPTWVTIWSSVALSPASPRQTNKFRSYVPFAIQGASCRHGCDVHDELPATERL